MFETLKVDENLESVRDSPDQVTGGNVFIRSRHSVQVDLICFPESMGIADIDCKCIFDDEPQTAGDVLLGKR